MEKAMRVLARLTAPFFVSVVAAIFIFALHYKVIFLHYLCLSASGAFRRFLLPVSAATPLPVHAPLRGANPSCWQRLICWRCAVSCARSLCLPPLACSHVWQFANVIDNWHWHINSKLSHKHTLIHTLGRWQSTWRGRQHQERHNNNRGSLGGMTNWLTGWRTSRGSKQSDWLTDGPPVCNAAGCCLNSTEFKGLGESNRNSSYFPREASWKDFRIFYGSTVELFLSDLFWFEGKEIHVTKY